MSRFEAKSVLSHSYGCIMAPFGEDVTRRVHQLAASIPDEFIYNDDTEEYGRQEGVHVTVKYGLHTSDVEEVVAGVSGWPPLNVVLGRTSVFHGDNDYVVLKLSAQSRDLVSLNRHVSRTFEVTDAYPDYNPHVTIAYLVKNPKDPYYYREFYTDEFQGQVEEIDELEFSPADGPSEFFPLTGSSDEFQAMQLLDMARDVIGDTDAL